ncbi:PREDICTED: putative GTP diphosphokinase RSH1, chloroplastic isoform X2 [Fragaria vesca subsp. vesca]|uniref:putative GTP diphosphokinase RSH1, chloroplastic isoform X2 n=1 Tax=Fragaria vesca subsp. vesca TaxID=101020 RepID=UPI0002C2DE99|nr:PREDICTED: putative GTP diphosphokinase RSH1, chloroplastic isoform X2 [Fragaria vesca subsp. vesca]
MWEQPIGFTKGPPRMGISISGRRWGNWKVQCNRSSKLKYRKTVAIDGEYQNEAELDWEFVASGLLHDTVEDTNVVTFERIEEEFGATVRHIVEGETKVSKLGKLKRKGEHDFVQDVKAYDLRQMLLAMTEEVRVIIVK